MSFDVEQSYRTTDDFVKQPETMRVTKFSFHFLESDLKSLFPMVEDRNLLADVGRLIKVKTLSINSVFFSWQSPSQFHINLFFFFLKENNLQILHSKLPSLDLLVNDLTFLFISFVSLEKTNKSPECTHIFSLHQQVFHEFFFFFFPR